MTKRVLVAVLACLAVAGVTSVAWAAIGDGGTVKTCFAKGKWTPIDTSASCKSGEQAIDLYSKAGADAAFLGKTAQAADSDKLDGIDSTGFVQTANLPSIRYGIIDGTTNTIHASSGGWTATRTGTGTYTITFGDTGHGQTIVSLTPIGGNPPGSNCVLGNALADNAYEVRCYDGNGLTPWVASDVAYHVIAIGG